MTFFERALAKASEDLEAIGRPWALVGGLAVAVWAEPRLTRDIDVAVAVGSDAEAEAVVRELGALGWRVVEVIEHEAMRRMATARLDRADGELEGIVLDLLFASSGTEAEIAREATRVELFPGLTLPVASRPHLIAMKLLARDDRTRPQDADDLQALIRAAAPAELDAARSVARSIEERGYGRKRDLVSLLDRAIGEPR